jgi:hypothetical protein
MLTMTTLRRLWNANAPLTATGLVMLLALAGFLVGLGLDPRTIAGAPAWLKPAKFALSFAIYTLTLAWVFGHLTAWPRTRWTAGWVTAVTLVLEVAIIGVQAWRGTTSHFNVATAGDAILFSVMGAAILAQTLAGAAVALALWRERFADPALGWALRLGMTITLIGASMGGLMTQPTAAQLAEAEATGRMAQAGAHTVGGADGGPGLPGTAWSREHGDLRVPHFLGLHALQALPLLGFLLGRATRSERRRVGLTLVAAGSYLGLFVLLLVQALRGEPLLAPSAATATMAALWLLLTSAAAWLAVARASVGSRHSAVVVG